MSALDPGWYADPASRPDALRWWDGSRWTRWLSHDADAEPPAAERPGGLGEPAPRESEPAEPAVRAPLAAAIIIGAVLVALIAVGAIVALSDDSLPSGAAMAPPVVVPPIPKTSITYDPRTRAASVLEFRDVQPGPPFVCQPPATQTGVFSSAISCGVVVHRDFNAGGDDWYASQVVGVLDHDLVEPGDAVATLDKLAGAIGRLYYSNEHPTVKKRVVKRVVDIAPAGKGLLLTMELHYSVRGLPSRYDRLVIGLFELADGEFVTWLAGNPDDAPKAVGRALDASASSVRAQP